MIEKKGVKNWDKCVYFPPEFEAWYNSTKSFIYVGHFINLFDVFPAGTEDVTVVREGPVHVFMS